MRIKHITVINRVAKYSSRDGGIICNNDGYEAAFAFDSEWDKYPTKYARFVWNGMYKDVPITDGKCPIPKIQGASELLVGVCTGDPENITEDDFWTTTSASIPCEASILCKTNQAQPDRVQQMRDITIEASERAVASATSAEANAAIAKAAAESASASKASVESTIKTATDNAVAQSTAAAKAAAESASASKASVENTIKTATDNAVAQSTSTAKNHADAAAKSAQEAKEAVNGIGKPPEVVQTKGDSESAVMSQKATTVYVEEYTAGYIPKVATRNIMTLTFENGQRLLKDGTFFPMSTGLNNATSRDYIEVEGGKTYTLSWKKRDTASYMYVFMYDEDKTLISNPAVQTKTQTVYTVQTPDNCHYICISFYCEGTAWQDLLLEDFQMEKGAVVTNYTAPCVISPKAIDYSVAKEQLSNYLEESTTEAMEKVIQFSANLFNPKDEGIKNGYFLDGNGAEIANANLFISGKIPVVNGNTYLLTVVSGLTASLLGAMYDKNGVLLGIIAGTLNDEGTAWSFFINDINVAYIRINNRLDNKSKAMVVCGETYPTEYIPYKHTLDEYFGLNERQQEESTNIAKAIAQDTVSKLFSVKKGGNLFNKNSDEVIRSAYFNTTSGGIKTDDEFAKYRFITHYIPVQEGKDYVTLWAAKAFGHTARVFLYDSEYNYLKTLYIAGLDNTIDTAHLTFNISEPNTAYIRLHYNLSLIDSYMLVEGTIYPEEYLLYGDDEFFIENEKVESPLAGKIISFNGDSICAGAGASGGYGKIIADNNGMIYENIGVSGAYISYSASKANSYQYYHCISRTVSAMRADADYIILEGGVNDASAIKSGTSDVTLGAISEGYTAELDDTTFYGAFEKMLKEAIVRFAGRKIGYIAVHKMTTLFNSEDDQDNSCYWAAKKCCEKWGVPFLDLNTTVPPFNYLRDGGSLDTLRETYTANGDGWHPNEEGYKKYYVPKIEAWLKTL